MNIKYYCHAPYCNKILFSKNRFFGAEEKNWLANKNWLAYDLNGHCVILCDDHASKYEEILIEAEQQSKDFDNRRT